MAGEKNYPFLSDVEDWQNEWLKAIYEGPATDVSALSRPAPDKLYSYRRITIRNLINIAQSQIGLSDPSRFNDPYDSYISPDMVAGFIQKIFKVEKDDPLIKHTVTFYNVEERKRYFHTLDVYVSCLTESNDNMLMWSHYADGHKGICIEYDMKRYLEDTNKFMSPLLYPVIYTDKISEIYVSTVGNELLCMYNNFSYILACCKLKTWKYEKEWRFIIQKEQVNKYEEEWETPCDSFSCSISAIYFGLNTSRKEKDLIADLVKNTGIRLYDMCFSPDKPVLESHPYGEEKIIRYSTPQDMESPEELESAP